MERDRQMTHAYMVGIDLRNDLREGVTLRDAIRRVDGPFETLRDSYPKWHPVPYSFEGMLRLFYHREITGWSYRNLAEYPELAETFGLERIPDESVLSRAWRERFDAAVREFVTTGAHYVVKEIHDLDLSVPLARPTAENVLNIGIRNDTFRSVVSRYFDLNYSRSIPFEELYGSL